MLDGYGREANNAVLCAVMAVEKSRGLVRAKWLLMATSLVIFDLIGPNSVARGCSCDPLLLVR